MKNELRLPIVLWRPHPQAPAQLVDGRNRLDAIEIATGSPAEVGAPTITAGQDFLACDRVIVLDKLVDPFAYVVSANILRRHLAPARKRKLMAELIRTDPAKSDRQIAEMVKASPTTVGTVRRQLESSSTVQSGQLTMRVGKDGKSRQQPTKRKAKPIEADLEAGAAGDISRAEAARQGIPEARQQLTNQPTPLSHDDIGPDSSGEIERLRARNEKLKAENRQLKFENFRLHREIEKLKTRLQAPTDHGDGLDIPAFLD